MKERAVVRILLSFFFLLALRTLFAACAGMAFGTISPAVFLVCGIGAVVGMCRRSGETVLIFVALIPVLIVLAKLGGATISNLAYFLFSLIFCVWFVRNGWSSPPVGQEARLRLVRLPALLGMLSLAAFFLVYRSLSNARILLWCLVPPFDNEYTAFFSGQIFLQGMMLCFMIDYSYRDVFCRWFRSILRIHLGFFFAFYIFFIIASHDLIAFFSPFYCFEDMHSFASYMLLLFFFFAFSPGHGRMAWVDRIASWVALGLVLVSFSRAAWLALVCTAGAIGILRCFRRMPLRSLAGLVLVGLLLFHLTGWLEAITQSKEAPETTTEKFIARFHGLVDHKGWQDEASLQCRLVLYKKAMQLIAAYPLTGTGPGSFWRMSGLDNIPKNPFGNYQENTHNYFLQIAAEYGLPCLVGLLLSLTAALRLGRDPARKGLALGVGAYLLTSLTGHPLLLSSQQLLFWFVLAGLLLPAPDSPDGDAGTNRVFNPLLALLVGLVLAGYAMNLVKADFPPRAQFGLYPFEPRGRDWWQWTMGDAQLPIEPRRDIFRLTFSNHALGVKGGLPQQVALSLDGAFLDTFVLEAGQQATKTYFVPKASQQRLILGIRTDAVIPALYGAGKDTRLLGVAMAPIEYIAAMPPEGVGFYQEERWPDGVPFPDVEARVRTFRWTSGRASLPVDPDNHPDGLNLVLWASHPDLEQRPVHLTISCAGEVIRSICFNGQSPVWKIHLPAKDLTGGVLDFQVDRLWSPQGSGISLDKRHLGVAVAVD